MIYYIKFEEDVVPTQFTTALEAKEHIVQKYAGVKKRRRKQAFKVFFAFTNNPDRSVDNLKFDSFDEENGVREAIDNAKSLVEEAPRGVSVGGG